MMSWAKTRWIAWAARCALWLAIVSPVVSQVLASPTLPYACGTAAELSMLNHAAMHGDAGNHAAMDGGQAPGDVCGYCSLFAHFPFALTLAATLATLPALPVPARRHVPARPATWRPDFAFDSRGPPSRLF